MEQRSKLLDSANVITRTQMWTSAAAVVCAFAIALLAAPAEPELRIAVNTTTIESFPVFVAAESLPSGPTSLRVQLVPTPNGRAAMAQLVGGTVDAATGSETQALLNSV